MYIHTMTNIRMYMRRIYTYIIHIRKQIHKSSEGGEMGTTVTQKKKNK